MCWINQKRVSKYIEYPIVIQGHPEKQLTMGRPEGAKNNNAERKAVIVELAAIGVKQRDIVEHFKMPQSTVANIIRKINATSGEIETRGRKPKSAVRSMRLLLS